MEAYIRRSPLNLAPTPFACLLLTCFSVCGWLCARQGAFQRICHVPLPMANDEIIRKLSETYPRPVALPTCVAHTEDLLVPEQAVSTGQPHVSEQ